MSVDKRTQTLLLLVEASTNFVNAMSQANVADELREILRISKMEPQRRRRFLRVLHLARSLETSLLEVIHSRGLSVPAKPSMGAYLLILANCSPPVIPQSVRSSCQARVATLRNHLAHGAGNYPTGNAQVDSAFQAADACLALILR